MKVVLIYRKQRSDAYSIEELFHAIGAELRHEVELVEFESGERRDLLRDVRELRRMRADIYHVTGDVNYFIPLLPSGRTVLTVHDIGHLISSLTGWKRLLYKWLWFDLPLRKAAAVTCVSHDTQAKLAQHLGVAPARAAVIENCYSPRFRHVPHRFNKAHPRILQVGTKPYKNVPRLVRALHGIQCTLVLIGKLDADIRSALAETGVQYENRMNLTHEDLIKEYIAADFVTFPSIGEGFGVPIVEAQATGRPLVTSDVSPLRDVAGQGACLVDPNSEASIRTGVLRVMEDDAYRERIVEAGLLNARRYSPAGAARKYLEVYRSLSMPRSRSAMNPGRSLP